MKKIVAINCEKESENPFKFNAVINSVFVVVVICKILAVINVALISI